uniref:SH3 domain-containing protein n=1 Tax=Heterorhabditis bacteriophora TaxID=37862 RepID=A0A1I7XV93_HETBA
MAQCSFEPDDNLLNQASEQRIPCGFLKLITGDRICVYSDYEGWGFGSQTGVKGESGLFPLEAVHFVQKQSQTDFITEGSSLVEEINEVTQKWWARIKDIYSKHTEMHYLDEVLDFIDEMLSARKKILSGGVPSEELNSLRIQLSRKIDRGNMLLSLNVTVRKENGVPFDPEAISILQTYQEHRKAHKKIGTDVKDQSDFTFEAFSVVLRVQSIELHMKYNCEISMVLYDLDSKRFITDTFTFVWKSNEKSTRDLNIRALFTNFFREDIGRRLVLVTRVAHIAPIESSSSTLKKNHEPGPPSLYCRQGSLTNPYPYAYYVFMTSILVYAFDFLDLTTIFENPQPSNDAKDKCFETISASGVKWSSDYRSFVHFHEDKPHWFENVKIKLSEDTSRDLHLRITFYSRKPYDKGKPEKGPFAMAHVRLLWNAALLPNGDHELLVYKIESSNYDDTNTGYLPLPQTRKTSSPNLVTSLAALASPVGDTENEMVRFLCPLLDALFEMWEERDQLELPVFDAIVSVLRLTDEQRHSKSSEILKKYMDRFPYSEAAIKLMRCLNHYIASAATSNNEKTRNSLKVMGHVFRTVIQSKKSGDSFSSENLFSTKFRDNLESVLESLIGLMGESRERMAVQNTALKHLPSIIDPISLSGAYEPTNLCKFLIRVIHGFGKNIVARERLGFVAHLIETHLFEIPACRSLLLPRCLDLVLVHLDPDCCEEKEFVERANECVSIMGNLVERLFPSVISPPTSSYGTDEELNLIINIMYRSIVQAMAHISRYNAATDELRGQFFALILALLNKMSAQIFGQYIENRSTDIDKMDFLMEMVQMIRDLLCKCPFPTTWQHMIMLQNKTVHKALRFVMSAIQGYFSNEKGSFYSDIWQEYMLTMVCFVTQPPLQSSDEWLRDETDVRFQLRKAAAKDLRSMWFRLTPSQKMEYIPRLVGAFLKVALVEDDETRDATIPIFFDMMQCEYHSCIEDNKSFKKFWDELITQLDCLVGQGKGTRAFQEHFIRILTSQCQSDKELWDGGGRDFISRVDHLLNHLFEYRLVRETSDCMENGMNRTVQLLRYYEKYGHHDLYITYVYKLYDLHMIYQNEIEAAKTLMLHANTLSWDEVELDESLVSRRLNRQCATQRQLKDRLLSEAADLFAQGEMWEDAIHILRELVPVYEKTYVDYDKLASLMICNVDPISLSCPFDDAHVNPSIKDYYRHYNIRDFEYSRLEERKDTKWTIVEDSEVMRTWIIKRRLVTSERLPGILRFSQVISTSAAIPVNPLRRSVEQMQRKNKELMETALLVLHDRLHAVKKLSGEILGVVRPAVMGGIKNYEVTKPI